MLGPPSLTRLAECLVRLPGIGKKTAERLALYVFKMSEEEATALAEAVVDVKRRTRLCSVCCNVTEEDPCPICADDTRDASLLCVVEQPGDVIALERTGQFKGRYHVLQGALSPLDGVGPEQLRVTEFMSRLKGSEIAEVVLATNPNVEGEATALYLMKLIKPLGIMVTRIARGIPVGSDLDFADEVTLARALEGRQKV
ncbi:MAG: recombination protein RecR [Latescibacteria bacterium DG_63]|uniref:Recombination protein RecR n=2 Tax=Bacteria division TA06 TaxID=1156500 RepID=A0A0S8JFU8_UNCT6|nr:MAG: recombination protein RecR [Latescibacteria bacterium DG_63]KPK70534.1 MAG: recombination protein RecR [candidate division TA06 bacterium SM23_40]KPL08552.1 MAG: recombination protein RecR [candidate division TA06 bacterium SM1_40]